tara:strand:- start:1575 stop:1817 length:243 start_codon:yes stop_codon:yes gene_type:complete
MTKFLILHEDIGTRDTESYIVTLEGPDEDKIRACDKKYTSTDTWDESSWLATLIAGEIALAPGARPPLRGVEIISTGVTI